MGLARSLFGYSSPRLWIARNAFHLIQFALRLGMRPLGIVGFWKGQGRALRLMGQKFVVLIIMARSYFVNFDEFLFRVFV